MGHKHIELTPKQEAYFVKHFKHTKNAELAEKLGISLRTVNRLATLYGLKKSPQFMHKMQIAASDAAKVYNVTHNNYPPKGYRIPRSEEFQFRPGESLKDRIGEKRWKAAHEKAVESRRKTLRYERARKTFGLEQKTKLRVLRQPKKRILDRYYLKKRGYVLDEQNFIAYWTPYTNRAVRLEAMPKRYYSFQQLPNND